MTRSWMYVGAGEEATFFAAAHHDFADLFCHTTPVAGSEADVSSTYGPVPIGAQPAALPRVVKLVALMPLNWPGQTIGRFHIRFCHWM